jgi:hypothetical protein
LATAVYCLSRSDKLRGGRLLFRTETEALGNRAILPGSLTIFPNSLMHRYDPFIGDGSIEIMTIHLVNPLAKILSWQHPQDVIPTMDHGKISKYIQLRL